MEKTQEKVEGVVKRKLGWLVAVKVLSAIVVLFLIVSFFLSLVKEDSGKEGAVTGEAPVPVKGVIPATPPVAPPVADCSLATKANTCAMRAQGTADSACTEASAAMDEARDARRMADDASSTADKVAKAVAAASAPRPETHAQCVARIVALPTSVALMPTIGEAEVRATAERRCP